MTRRYEVSADDPAIRSRECADHVTPGVRLEAALIDPLDDLLEWVWLAMNLPMPDSPACPQDPLAIYSQFYTSRRKRRGSARG